MAILGNKYNLIDDMNEEEVYTVPATIRKDDGGLSFKKSFVLSTILHPSVVGLIWLIVFLLALMGISFSLFERPKPKTNDIEFVLVDKEATPRNKHTKNRADMNSRSGGKTNPKKKVSMPSPSPAKRAVKSAPGPKAPAHKAVKQHQPTHTKSSQKVQPKHNIFEAFAPKPAAAPKPAKPVPPSARPTLKPPSMPKLSPKAASPFAVPVPKSASAPTGKSYSTGPVGGSGSSKTASGGSRGGSSGGGHYAPTPSLAPTGGGGGGSRLSSKGSSGYGNSGNPGGGGGRPGIDAIREPDFGPYMRELQRRIKMNWDPPKGNESKRVILLFKIARDGRLLSAKVYKSSGNPGADKAAINAVELTAPFRPLPAEFRGGSIDIQFTFDYNVFGASGYH